MKNLQTDLTLQEAVRLWREALTGAGWLETCTTEDVRIVSAMGRVTAHPVVAVRPVPHYAGAAMDGFAVRAADTGNAQTSNPITLKIVPFGEIVTPGTAALVDTGDALPPGADSVIMKEYVKLENGAIKINSAISLGQHVRQIGEDISAGALVLPAGHVIRPADIAAALASGDELISVMAKPRVAVIPTGDEIVDSAEEVVPGKIRDINSYMLAALLSSWEAEVLRYPVTPDDPAKLKNVILLALRQNDLVVMNAGTSGGTDDYTEQVLRSLGQVCCSGVAIRPGRPVLLAVIEGKPVIGLPGYPVSCLLTAELFLRDMVYEYQRRKPPERSKMQARLSRTVLSRLGVEEFVRVALTSGNPYAVASVLNRGASLISSLTQADGWLRIPADCSEINADSIVEVELF